MKGFSFGLCKNILKLHQCEFEEILAFNQATETVLAENLAQRQDFCTSSKSSTVSTRYFQERRTIRDMVPIPNWPKTKFAREARSQFLLESLNARVRQKTTFHTQNKESMQSMDPEKSLPFDLAHASRTLYAHGKRCITFSNTCNQVLG